MKRKIIAVITALMCSFLLSGCDIFTNDTLELLSPPALTGDISPISAAIAESVGKEYTLKYPSKGNFRSAVVQNDIDGDGILEAFAFYSVSENETVTMYINVISNKDGKWKSIAQQSIVAGGVDRLDFCDLDNDGVLEILVGWEIYGTSEMQLAVYSLKNNELTQRMLQKYTHFVCCDLNEDSINEIFLIKFSAAEQINSAAVYELNDNGVTEIYSCELDKTAQSVNEPVVSTLSSGRPAVYIDEVKGVGAVTEVLFVEKNVLVNPLMNSESHETLDTLRASNISVKDINGDGIIEIPVQENVPSITKSAVNEKLYLTTWCTYNGETLTKQITAMLNSTDGYSYTLSEKWAGHMAVLKDTDEALREIYIYDNETATAGEMLISFKTVKKSDFENGKYNGQGWSLITDDEIMSYICKISDIAIKNGLTLDTVKQNFSLLG